MVPNHQPDITWGSIYNPIPLILNTPIAWFQWNVEIPYIHHGLFRLGGV